MVRPSECGGFLLFVREPVNYIGFFFPHLWKLPSPRVRTAQLPSVTPEAAPESHQDPYGGENTFLGGRNDYHQSTQQWTDTLAQEAEASTSLVTTKPVYIENESRSEVSECFFTPPKIMLYNNGLGNSRPVPRQVLGADITALRMTEKKGPAGLRSVRYWESRRRLKSLPSSRVRQPFRGFDISF